MNANPDLKELQRRPMRYWNADGLPELTMGISWVIWGTALGLPEILPAGGWLRWYWMIVPLILVVGGLASNWITRKVKERWTFPRGGYVAFREPSTAMKVLPAILAMVVASSIVVLIMKSETETLRDLAAPGCALLIALALLVPALRWQMYHFLLLSLLALGLAFAMQRMRMTLDHGFIFLFLALGAAAVLSGLLRLRSFLRKNPLEGVTQA